jgi:hypothetical protein
MNPRGRGAHPTERRRRETVGVFYAIVFVLLVLSLGLLEVAAS